ncbi:MAG TPA: hypothetical protein VFW87_19545, partial [Pirellulales bacterium]|nr:hypothetical protein [Pirellulales bacterium]
FVYRWRLCTGGVCVPVARDLPRPAVPKRSAWRRAVSGRAVSGPNASRILRTLRRESGISGWIVAVAASNCRTAPRFATSSASVLLAKTERRILSAKAGHFMEDEVVTDGVGYRDGCRFALAADQKQ